MPQEYDEFAGESGLVGDVDGTIIDTFFSTDAKIGNGQVLCLHVEVATDDPANPETVYIYGCGPDWASYDDGATAEHPKGAKQRFSGASKITKFYSAIIACGEAAEAEIRRRSREQFDGAGHRHADLTKGMKFHWDVVSEPYDFEDKNTGKRVVGVSNTVLPTAYLGVEDPDTAKANLAAPSTTSSMTTAPAPSIPTAAATASAPAPAASTTTPPTAATPVSTPPSIPPSNQPTPSSPLDTMTPEDAAKLRLLAKTQSYADFVDSALEIPGLPSNVAVVSMLGDESFYESLKV
jgi:hypothetical protein